MQSLARLLLIAAFLIDGLTGWAPRDPRTAGDSAVRLLPSPETQALAIRLTAAFHMPWDRLSAKLARQVPGPRPDKAEAADLTIRRLLHAFAAEPSEAWRPIPVWTALPLDNQREHLSALASEVRSQHPEFSVALAEELAPGRTPRVALVARQRPVDPQDPHRSTLEFFQWQRRTVNEKGQPFFQIFDDGHALQRTVSPIPDRPQDVVRHAVNLKRATRPGGGKPSANCTLCLETARAMWIHELWEEFEGLRLYFNPQAAWPPKPDAPAEKQPLQLTASWGGAHRPQSDLSDLQVLRTMRKAWMAMNASPSLAGQTLYRMHGNGSIYGNPAVHGGVTQDHVHTHWLRHRYASESAPIRWRPDEFPGKPGVRHGLVELLPARNGQEPIVALALETRGEALERLDEAVAETLEDITARGHSFNFLYLPQPDGAVRVLLTGRTRAVPSHARDAYGATEALGNEDLIGDRAERFYEMSPEQTAEVGTLAPHEQIVWIEQALRDGRIRVRLPEALQSDYRRGLEETIYARSAIEALLRMAALRRSVVVIDFIGKHFSDHYDMTGWDVPARGNGMILGEDEQSLYVLTCGHIAEGRRYTVRLWDGMRQGLSNAIPAEVVARQGTPDIGMLRIHKRDWPAGLAYSKATLAAPLPPDRRPDYISTTLVTWHPATWRDDGVPLLFETPLARRSEPAAQAELLPGMSGSPLRDEEGYAVGMVQSLSDQAWAQTIWEFVKEYSIPGVEGSPDMAKKRAPEIPAEVLTVRNVFYDDAQRPGQPQRLDMPIVNLERVRFIARPWSKRTARPFTPEEARAFATGEGVTPASRFEIDPQAVRSVSHTFWDRSRPVTVSARIEDRDGRVHLVQFPGTATTELKKLTGLKDPFPSLQAAGAVLQLSAGNQGDLPGNFTLFPDETSGWTFYGGNNDPTLDRPHAAWIEGTNGERRLGRVRVDRDPATGVVRQVFWTPAERQTEEVLDPHGVAFVLAAYALAWGDQSSRELLQDQYIASSDLRHVFDLPYIHGRNLFYEQLAADADRLHQAFDRRPVTFKTVDAQGRPLDLNLLSQTLESLGYRQRSAGIDVRRQGDFHIAGEHIQIILRPALYPVNLVAISADGRHVASLNVGGQSGVSGADSWTVGACAQRKVEEQFGWIPYAVFVMDHGMDRQVIANPDGGEPLVLASGGRGLVSLAISAVPLPPALSPVTRLRQWLTAATAPFLSFVTALFHRMAPTLKRRLRLAA